MTVARAYGLAFTVVLAWSAVDVMVAAWSHGRATTKASYESQRLALYGANLGATGFHEPQKLTDRAQELDARRPWWDVDPATEQNSGDWDAFGALAAAMGVG